MRKVDLGDYQLLTSPTQVQCLLHEMRGPVAFDYETTSLDPWQGKVVSVAVSDRPGRAWCFDPNIVAKEWAYFVTKNWMIAHNARFEAAWTMAHFGVYPRLVFDTKAAARLDDVEQSDSLDSCRERYTDYPDYKDLAPNFDQVYSIKDCWYYNCADADLTLQVSAKQRVDQKLMKKTMDHTEVLVRARARGIKVLAEKIRPLKLYIRTRLSQIREELLQIPAYMAFYKWNGDQHINFKSPKQKRKLLFEHLGLRPLTFNKRNKSGDRTPKTDSAYLRAVAESGPVPKLMLEAVSLRQLRENFLANVERQLDDQGLIHPDWNVLATRSWRIGCFLHTLPKGSPLLDLLVPRSPDHVWVEMDYSQLELRILASLSGDPGMVEAFQAGVDIHARTASEMFEVPLDDVTKAVRAKGKTGNFAAIYGVTEVGMWDQFLIPPKEAEEILERYWDAMPVVAAWKEEVIGQAREDGYVDSMYGRRRPLPGINGRWPGHWENVAVNHRIQSTGGEMCLDAMVEIERTLPDVEILGQKHDSIIFQVSRDSLQRRLEQVREIMCRQGAGFIKVPLVVDAKVGPSWGQKEEISSGREDEPGASPDQGRGGGEVARLAGEGPADPDAGRLEDGPVAALRRGDGSLPDPQGEGPGVRLPRRLRSPRLPR